MKRALMTIAIMTTAVAWASSSLASPLPLAHPGLLRLDGVHGAILAAQNGDRALAPRFSGVPSSQPQHGSSGDSLWNGMLIGGAAGALYGFVIAPPQFCGSNDPECGAIVKVAIGLPSVAGGVAVGALIDYFVGRERPDSASNRHRVYVTPIVGRGARGGAVRVRF